MRGKFKEYAHLNKMCDVRVYVKHMCIHVLLPESTFQRAFWRWRHPRRKNPILFCFPSLIYCYQYSFVQGDDILASKIPFYLIVPPSLLHSHGYIHIRYSKMKLSSHEESYFHFFDNILSWMRTGWPRPIGCLIFQVSSCEVSRH